VRKKSQTSGKIVNRRARYDYELGDTYLVGLELSGAEAKSLRLGHGQLRGAYVTEKGGELWLTNAQITGVRGILIDENDQLRSRKVLAKKR
jgi:SsrA-binding protein